VFIDFTSQPKGPPVGTTIMILQHLKQATSQRHTALECQLPLLDPLLTRDDYRRFVCRFLGYYAPLETRLLALPWWRQIGFDYGERYKTPHLVQDMLALGVTDDTLATFARCQDLPCIDTLPQALGCLYVIEGATLGGQLVTRHLQQTLGVTPRSGSAFFNGYGGQTGARWKSFGALLTTHAEQTGDHAAIIDTANHTFETFDRWLFPRAPMAAANH
jgi:heme oxygenase (biliverdin-IX-beta and delta-forming)